MRELKVSCDELDDASALELRDLADCVAAFMLLPAAESPEVANRWR